MKINIVRIETLMAEKRLTRKALSDLSGVSPTTLSTVIRRGTAEPKTIGKLAAGLSVDVTDIIEEGKQ
ncbi:MAG: helix-turn-helix domain-containing protein [Oscillospiraceae bacterium]|jgi:DNA-binding Xre family transcriptional regulator